VKKRLYDFINSYARQNALFVQGFHSSSKEVCERRDDQCVALHLCLQGFRPVLKLTHKRIVKYFSEREFFSLLQLSIF
jgi:hypothetical protein